MVLSLFHFMLYSEMISKLTLLLVIGVLAVDAERRRYTSTKTSEKTEEKLEICLYFGLKPEEIKKIKTAPFNEMPQIILEALISTYQRLKHENDTYTGCEGYLIELPPEIVDIYKQLKNHLNGKKDKNSKSDWEKHIDTHDSSSNVEETLSGNVEETQSGNIEETQSGNIEETQSGNYKEALSSDVEETLRETALSLAKTFLTRRWFYISPKDKEFQQYNRMKLRMILY